ncbi:MAG: hypothetical protein RL479_2075, partial [Verrucomicrobiota bacterium]
MAADLDLDGALEAEERRVADLELEVGQVLERGADALDQGNLGLRRGAGQQAHGEARGVLAAVDRGVGPLLNADADGGAGDDLLGSHDLVDPLRERRGAVDRRTDGEGDIEVELALMDDRDEVAADAGQHEHAAGDDGRDGTAEDREAMAEGGPEKRRVAALEPVVGALERAEAGASARAKGETDQAAEAEQHNGEGKQQGLQGGTGDAEDEFRGGPGDLEGGAHESRRQAHGDPAAGTGDEPNGDPGEAGAEPPGGAERKHPGPDGVPGAGAESVGRRPAGQRGPGAAGRGGAAPKQQAETRQRGGHDRGGGENGLQDRGEEDGAREGRAQREVDEEPERVAQPGRTRRGRGGEAEEGGARQLGPRDGEPGGAAGHHPGQHRNQVERGDQRSDLGEHHRQGEVAEHLPGHALDEHNREEHRHGRERRGDHGHRDLAGAADDRPHRVVALLPAPEHALEHYNRVIDQVAHPEREPTQRDDIERDPRKVHRRERREDRDRDRQADDQRLRQVPQEQVQDDHRDQAALHRVAPHLVDRVLDEDRLVGEHLQRDAPGQLEGEEVGQPPVVQQPLRPRTVRGASGLDGTLLRRRTLGGNASLAEVRSRRPGLAVLQRRHILLLLRRAQQGLAHRFRHNQHVRVRLFVDLNLDALLAVDAGDDLAVLVEAGNRRDVPQAHIHAVLPAHDQLPDLLERTELVEGADQVLDLALVEAAAG